MAKKFLVAGIDEVGRGPLAGPVVAAALVLKDSSLSLRGSFDSKRLSERAREELYAVLKAHPGVEWGIGMVSERVIDRVNIRNATRLAMEKAVRNLEKKGVGVGELIIDGNMLLSLPCKQRAVPHGDDTVPLCMLASIVAKVERDRLMRRLHQKYPKYGFDRHKGYGTRYHMEALKKYGPCPLHRKSFAPVARSLN